MSFRFIKAGMLLAAVMTLTSQVGTFAQKAEKGFKSIFDGKTLKGWDGDPKYWRVENGSLVGEITPETLLKTNSFIIWRGGEPGDFELKGSFRIAAAGNSGINYRSEQLIKSEDWNTFHLVVKGNHLQHYINGVLMSDVTDNDTVNGAKKGLLGVQVHVGPPMKVEYKDLRIKQ
jgi:hypothetical protein